MSHSALRAAIKCIAIGKFGTKPIPADLIPQVHNELLRARTDASPPLQLLRASFLGALFVKKRILPAEMRLLSTFTPRVPPIGRKRTVDGVTVSAAGLLAAVSSDVGALQQFAMRLLDGEVLTMQEAERLGALLYSGVATPLKALVAHVMRVRHETATELAGLAIAAGKTVPDSFCGEKDADVAYVHVAEPYDGAITWDIITPLLCRHLYEKHGMRPVMGVGESSGPKYGPNLCDVATELGISMCGSREDIVREFTDGGAGGKYGVAVDQRVCSPGLHEWVYMRQVIIKRPAIATVEKYVDVCPGGASLFIASAFHTSYVEKMAVAAEGVGFPAYIIVGKGMEGSIGLGARKRRSATLLTGWRVRDSYEREELKFSSLEDGGGDDKDVEKGMADVGVMSKRIRNYVQNGESGHNIFDLRVRATLLAFDQALALLGTKVPHVLYPTTRGVVPEAKHEM